MPLLHHAEVSPLPLPTQLGQLNPDTELWLIHSTGEIFTDYESYANRYIFYSQPIFTPKLLTQQHQQSTVSFFHAINIEHDQLDWLIQANFPTRLKQIILATINHQPTQLLPNIDRLVDYLYHLYHNRFNVGDKVSINLAFKNHNQPTPSSSSSSSSSSSVYDAKVLRVFPPKQIRDLDKNDYSHLIHLQSPQHFPIDLNQCLQFDDPTSYLYTIQLIDHEKSDHFGASYMEVETKKLSRHTDTFSKPLLKRFLQSILIPHSSNNPPFPRWIIHPDISIPTNIHPPPPIPVPNYKSLTKNILNNPTLKSNHHLEPDTKKRKKNNLQASHQTVTPSYQDYLNNPTHLNQSPLTCTQFFQLSPKQKTQLTYHPKHLDSQQQNNTSHTLIKKQQSNKKNKKTLEPIHPTIPTFLNGNPHHHPPHLNPQQLNSAHHTHNHSCTTTPSTATKESKKSIKYPIEDLDLDPFTVIDGRYLRRANPTPLKLPKKPIPSQRKLGRKFAQRLKIWSFVNIFKLNERRCRFDELDASLDNLTACLVKLILSQTRLRYPTTRTQRFTSISVLPFFATHPAQECQVMSIDEREYWVRKGLRFVNVTRRLHEFALNTTAGKRKLNRPILEEDWVMGLVEVMCHRGGIERLGCMARMLKYFFSTDATLLTIDHTIDQDVQPTDQISDSQKLHPNTKHAPSTSNFQPSAANLEGDSPLSSNLDDGLTVQESDLSVDGQDQDKDMEPEAGVETADEDGRRYGRSIRSQRNNPRQLRKTLMLRYAELPVDDKLTLIEFLCDLATESEQVRNYMEKCDERLTVVRREKADVNKEKRKVLEELARLEARRVEAAAQNDQKPSSTTELDSALPPNDEASSIKRQLKDPPADPPLAPAPSNEEILLSGNGVSAEPGEDCKPRPTPIEPPNTITSTCSQSVSLDSPQTKSHVKNPETVKPSAVFRPLETAVRTATLLARQIKPPSQTEEGTAGQLGREKRELEGQLFEIGLRELIFQERFRQLIGVTKLKPLGMDRFFCKYWWFDGIGGLEIHEDEDCDASTKHSRAGQEETEEETEKEAGSEGEDRQASTNWYAGCIFVSGPSMDEWDKISSAYGGHRKLLRRRFHEELGASDLSQLPEDEEHAEEVELKERLLGVDEWGIYETEEQIDELMVWLNAKGVRENGLKMNLKDWKEYITDGFHRRQALVSLRSPDGQGQDGQQDQCMSADSHVDVMDLNPAPHLDQIDGDLDGSDMSLGDDDNNNGDVP
ncbi:hypothetical protein VP01_40g4 [Puccinia sorghi]|uniref:WAC domain-containing protein n=1 Tax=Puccinia sorghi TaxID=27349 RepID=A0A0L6UT88_9BASI|nr:hypothetical protein VP01_40g4 [Puccinia sorghi]